MPSTGHKNSLSWGVVEKFIEHMKFLVSNENNPQEIQKIDQYHLTIADIELSWENIETNITKNNHNLHFQEQIQ